MKLRWLLTAGFEIITDNYKILIDPFISRPANAIPSLKTRIEDIKNYNAVFLSHGHFDHAMDIPELVSDTGTRVYCSGFIADFFVSAFNMDPNNFTATKTGRTYDFPPDFTVRVIRSRHIRFNNSLILKKIFSRDFWKMKDYTGLSLRDLSRYKAGEVLGHLFEFSGGKKIFHLGSGGYYREELERLPRDIDIFLAPVAGRNDCDKVLAEAAGIFKPKMIIPHHYDDFFPPLSFFAYKNFDEEVKKIDQGIAVNKIEPETFLEF